MKKGSLISKFFSFSIGSWLSIIVGLLGTPIITRILSPTEFGKASMFILALNILLLLSLFGSDQSFVRFFYEEKEEDRKYLLYKCLKVSLCIFVILATMITILYKPITNFLFSKISISLALFLIITVLFQIFNRFSTLVIRMEQKGLLFSLLQFLMKLLELIGFLAFFYFLGARFETLAYAQFFNTFFVTIIAIFFGFSFWSFFRSKDKSSNYNIKELMKYGVPLGITLLVTWVFQSTDRIVLKEWSSYSELGLYTAAFKIVSILNVIQTSFTTFWVPVSYERYKNNPNNKQFFSNMAHLIMFGMFLVGIGTLIFKDIIVLMLGSEYRDASSIMPFLVFMPIMYTISEVTVVGINFAKKTKWHILISIISCLINLVGNIALVPVFGAKGAAIATGLSYIIFMVLRTLISLRYYKVDYGLKRFFIMTGILILFATISTFSNRLNVFNLTFEGLVILLLLLLFYKKNFLFNMKNNGS